MDRVEFISKISFSGFNDTMPYIYQYFEENITLYKALDARHNFKDNLQIIGSATENGEMVEFDIAFDHEKDAQATLYNLQHDKENRVNTYGVIFELAASSHPESDSHIIITLKRIL